jgi:hypothetical protein
VLHSPRWSGHSITDEATLWGDSKGVVSQFLTRHALSMVLTEEFSLRMTSGSIPCLGSITRYSERTLRMPLLFYSLTITFDDIEAPPRLARTGADRCIRRNVAMNADEPWEAIVR